jgi:hypothetical protein
MVEKLPIIEKKKLQMIDIALGSIELGAEKMAKRIVDNKRGPKKSIEEELLKEVPELTEIKMMVLLAKASVGLIAEKECGVSARKLLDSHNAISKKK